MHWTTIAALIALLAGSATAQSQHERTGTGGAIAGSAHFDADGLAVGAASPMASAFGQVVAAAAQENGRAVGTTTGTVPPPIRSAFGLLISSMARDNGHNVSTTTVTTTTTR